MIYYKIIAWGECSFCLKAKMELINRQHQFEYCVIDHSPELLNIYKSNYNYDTVPLILKINMSTGQERFIGGYTDLIKHFQKSLVEGEVSNLDGTRGI
jgi:glutaredoxin